MSGGWFELLVPLLGLVGLFFLLRPVRTARRPVALPRPEPQVLPSSTVPSEGEMMSPSSSQAGS